MARKVSYASIHNGKAQPWRSRDVDLVIPLRVARTIRRQVRQLNAADPVVFTIRSFGTVMLWRQGAPFGSFTMVQNHPRLGLATVRRVAWDERRGFAEADVWRAIDELAGERVGM